MKIRNILHISLLLLLVGCTIVVEGCGICSSVDAENVRVVGPGYDCVGTIYRGMGNPPPKMLRCNSGEEYYRISNYRIIK